MQQAVRIHAHGGPEELRTERVAVGRPGPGEALVEHAAIGLNFIDVYHRTGLYPVGLPATLGVEAAGVVTAVGPEVDEVAVGDRVAYVSGPGAYCAARVLPADRLVPVPAGISDALAAASLLKGMTAQYLLRRTYPVQAGETILVHAAAGGVGLLLCQWARHLGATVIGTVGSDEKAALAREAGCEHVIVYSREAFAPVCRELTGGVGVSVVYDGVGQATFAGSLDSLRPLGMLVSYGQASGPIAPFDVGLLGRKGSLFLTRPSLFTYVAQRGALLAAAAELFDLLEAGVVRVQIGQRFALSEAGRAHAALEARETTGSTVLLPEPREGQPGEGQPGEGQPGEGQPGEGQPGEGQPGEGPPGEGQPGEGQEDDKKDPRI